MGHSIKVTNNLQDTWSPPIDQSDYRIWKYKINVILIRIESPTVLIIIDCQLLLQEKHLLSSVIDDQ